MNDVEDAYELSPTQEGMLFHGLDDGSSGVDLEQVVGTLEEALHETAFREAWERVIARHAILRTAFRWDGLTAPRQEVHRHVTVAWERLDWRDVSVEERAGRREALLAADRRLPFDLARTPLMRFALVEEGEALWTFLWSFHHALLDGRAFPLVLREVFAAYEALRTGEAWEPPAPRSYRDYIVWLRGRDMAAAEEYWTRTLEGFRAPTPVGVSRGPGAAEDGMGACEVRLSEVRTSALREFARTHDLTLNTLLQGAWALLLHRYTGEEDIVFGSTRACRRSALGGADDLVGLLINTLPIRVRVEPRAALVLWLRRLREIQIALRPHEHTPLVKVKGWSQVPRGRPLFESLVVFDNETLEAGLRSLGGAWSRRRFIYRGQTNYPVTLIGYGDQELLLRVEHDRARISDAAGRRLLGHVVTIMEGMAAASADTAVATLPILSAEERRGLAPPAAARLPTAGLCLHERFEAQVSRTPDATALVFEGASLTYAELNRKANRLAHRLRSMGVGPETLVGLSLERSLDLVVAVLGILKAGGAYLPLDPAYPKDRLAFMVKDARVSIIVTERSLGDSLPSGSAIHVLVDDPGEWSEGDFASGACAANLAYVIYTSGSTGKPKGCQITHGNVTRLFDATDSWFGFGTRDVWTLFHSYAFDFTVWEIWGSLLYGGRLVVVPYWVSRSPDAFHELLRREGVTVLNQTPSAFRHLIQADLAAGAAADELALRYVIFGGEALDLQSLRPWFARHGDRQPRLVNMYGITETTVHVTYRPLTMADVEAGAGSMIGIPIPDLYVRLLDPQGQPVPIGVPGEMYVGGAGVARGYLSRPALTADRFVRDPLSGEPTARLYRTGDLACRLEDGDLEYLGRIDHQVKIHGFRIELGEIEAVLSQHPAVREAVVLAREDTPGDRRLVAYLATAADRVLLVDELRARLKAAVPEYMVPAAFVFVDRLPLTENGKVDRKALPAPDPARAEGRVTYVPPGSRAEKVLCGIWAAGLAVARVGIHDNFFELGGDSILSIQVVARARAEGLSFTPRDLFKRPTVAELVAGLAAPAEARPAVAAQGVALLTPVQRWFFELGLPDLDHWNQAFLFSTPADIDVGRLEAALQVVARHHDALRLRFRCHANDWQQTHAEGPGRLALERIDLSSRGEDERPRALEMAAAALHSGLNLERGPLARAALVSLGPGRPGRLILIFHHLIVDGVSWRILLEDVERAYAEGGGPASLPARTSSYQQWSERLAAHAAAGGFRRSLPYWLTAGTAGTLPTDHSTGDNTEASVCTAVASLAREETLALLQEMPAAYRTQINDALLTALARAMAAWTGGDRFRIDLEGHGREDLFADLDLSRTVGWFTTLFPFTLHLPADASEASALKAVKEQLRALPDRGLSFGALRYLDPEARARLSSLPRADLLFNYLGQFDQVVAGSSLFRFAPESAGPWRAPRGPRTHLIEVIGLVTEGCLEVRFHYSVNRHRAETIERLAGAFRAELLALIRHCRAASAGAFTPSDFPLVRLDQAAIDRLTSTYAVEDVQPLAPMQRLFHAMESAPAGIGFEPWRFRLRGSVDPAALRAAWDDVLARHEVLRSAYAADGLPEPVQVIVRGVRPEWHEEDWRDLSREEQEARSRALESTERAHRFDLARPPLTRLTLVRLEDEVWELVWSTHHLHVDGWSWPLVFRDLSALYEARRGGEPAALPRACTYGGYLAWLRDSAPDSEAFWRRSLAGFAGPTRILPSEGPFAGDREDPFGEQSARLPAEATSALHALARSRKLTLSTVVQAAWGLLLGHWSGDDDVTFGAAFSGRPAEIPGIEAMVGPCVNDLPVRTRLDGARSLVSWLRELQESQTEAAQHQYAPIDQIQEWAGIPWRLRLFDSLIVFQNYVVEEGARRLGRDVEIDLVSAPEATNYPVTLAVEPAPELRMRLLYHRNRTSAATAQAMLEDLAALLRALPAAADAPLASLLAQLPAATRKWAAAPRRHPISAPATPSTDLERRIAALWTELFQVSQVGLDDNFFDLGGHSLLLLRAHARLREQLGDGVQIVALFQHPTIRTLARHLAGADPQRAAGIDAAARARRTKDALSRRRPVVGNR